MRYPCLVEFFVLKEEKERQEEKKKREKIDLVFVGDCENGSVSF